MSEDEEARKAAALAEATRLRLEALEAAERDEVKAWLANREEKEHGK